jgi:hypothetical protein
MNTAEQPPRSDPLIDEIRRIRKEISEAHGNDVARLCDHLQEIQRRHAGRVVRRPSSKAPRSTGEVA